MNGSKSKGFTLLELIVSIAIFVFMTALLIAKFGNFNQSALLTNLAYDVAITLRTAQTFSISSVNANTGATPFQYPHGVHITTATTPANPETDNTKIIMFTDVNSDGKYNPSSSDVIENIYTLSRGAVISYLCIGDENNCAPAKRGPSDINLSSADITFRRPDPSALIVGSAASGFQQSVYIEISIPGVTNGTRAIVVSNNGQIYVLK